MSFFKKYAWYGSAVVASALLAVALLLTGPAGTASAGTVGTVTPGAPIQAAGLTETWTVTYTASGVTGITTGSVTFPSGFTVPSGTITGATAQGAGAACTTVAASGSGQVVSFTMDSCATAAAATNNFVIPGVVNTTTTGTTGNFTVSTSADATSNTGTAVIWNVAITKSPTTAVPADGASTVGLTITASNTAANNAGSGGAKVITIATNLGTFTAAPAGGGTIATGAGTIATDSMSATMDVQAAVATTTGESITLKAPGTGTAGTATVTVKVTPSSGGSAVLLGITQVSFTAPAATPGVVAAASITAPTTSTATVTSTGNTNVTVKFTDANGNAPISGGTVTVTTTLGVLSTPTNGTCTNQSCSGTVPTDGNYTVKLTGGGVAGSGTITFTSNSISATMPVVVSGAVSTMTVTLSRVNPGIGSAPAASSSANRVAVTWADSAGNVVTGQTGALTIVEANSGITFKDAASAVVTSAGDAAAASDASTLGGTAPTAADGTAYAYYTIPTTAVAGTVYTIKATTGTVSATATLTVAGPVATVTIASDPASVDAAGTSTLTITALDATGNPAQDGSTIAAAVSAGAVVNCSASTLAGAGTCVFAAPGTAQNVNVTAVVTSGTTVKTGSSTVSVGGAAATATPTGTTGAGTFDRTIPNVGVNTAVYNGGTVDQLSAATAAAGGISVTVFINGQATVLIPGAPAFVNAAFNAAFPDGTVPSGTIVLVVK